MTRGQRLEAALREIALAPIERFTSYDFAERDMPGEYIRYGDHYKLVKQLRAVLTESPPPDQLPDPGLSVEEARALCDAWYGGGSSRTAEAAVLKIADSGGDDE